MSDANYLVKGHMGTLGEKLELYPIPGHEAMATLFQETFAMQEYITQHCQTFQFFKERVDHLKLPTFYVLSHVLKSFVYIWTGLNL